MQFPHNEISSKLHSRRKAINFYSKNLLYFVTSKLFKLSLAPGIILHYDKQIYNIIVIIINVNRVYVCYYYCWVRVCSKEWIRPQCTTLTQCGQVSSHVFQGREPHRRARFITMSYFTVTERSCCSKRYSTFPNVRKLDIKVTDISRHTESILPPFI